MSDPFNGAQRRSYSTPQDWTSLKTGSNTWLVVWNGSNYTGDYLKIGGANAASNSDLNNTKRSGGGDWKHQIQSFIIYANQPSWWSDTTPPPNNDLNLQPHDAIFCTGTDFNDETVVYTANAFESDLNSCPFPTNHSVDMKNDIQSLATGSSAWLQIWNDTNYSGSTLRIYPNTVYKDLNAVPRLPDGDWKNQMQSFKLYNSEPDASWSLGFDEGIFFKSFPHATKQHDSSGDYYHYTTQDCGYDIRITDKKYDTTTMTISFRIDWDVTGKNDKVYLDLTVNSDGTFNEVAYDYEQGDPTQISKKFIRAVDVSAEVLGAVGALETAGISEEAANSFIEAFDTFCDVFNKVSKILYKISASNDGRFYMVATATHVLCRAFSAITTNN